MNRAHQHYLHLILNSLAKLLLYHNQVELWVVLNDVLRVEVFYVLKVHSPITIHLTRAKISASYLRKYFEIVS